MKYIKKYFYTNSGVLKEKNANGGGIYENGVLSSTGAPMVPGVLYKITVEPIGADSKNPPERLVYENRRWCSVEDVCRAKKIVRLKNTKKNKIAIDRAKGILKENKDNIANFKLAIKFYIKMLKENLLYENSI